MEDEIWFCNARVKNEVTVKSLTADNKICKTHLLMQGNKLQNIKFCIKNLVLPLERLAQHVFHGWINKFFAN